MDAIANDRRRVFEILVVDESTNPPEEHRLCFPYSNATPSPSERNPVSRIWMERHRHGFAFVLRSDDWGMVWLEDVFEYEENRDFLRIDLLRKLTDEAHRRFKLSGRSTHEVVRRLQTSRTQLARLLSSDHSRKTVDGLVKLIHVLDGVVDVTVRDWRPFDD